MAVLRTFRATHTLAELDKNFIPGQKFFYPTGI